jgi:hypothetical protein
LLSVEVLHIGNVSTAADIQEFDSGCGYCFVFDDDWEDAHRKGRLSRAEKKWLAEFRAVGEEAKAKLQKDKGMRGAGKKRKPEGSGSVGLNLDEHEDSEPNASECSRCDTILHKDHLAEPLQQCH